ncbi:MAG: NAD(P)/FAD-dependent oxidoreductase [Gammaproteobacteria bacterium]|nr:NAD(P)/FAD-dependent oxidoreductase [Gammaproteobacteria bacterium]
MSEEYFDVVIVGAGLAGIGAAWHLQDKCPDRSYLVLEGRESMGGTWDLFRYPGIRSDSDMYTLGYRFRPWKEGKAIADGPSILKYIQETASEAGIDRNIRYQQAVVSAKWSSQDALWTLATLDKATGDTRLIRCNFLSMCSGYYNYEQGYEPQFAGREDFRGEIVHPQHWPADMDYSDKQVVIIGSGATAVTLLPAMAEKAAHVVMLQRSPTYIAAVPDVDWIARLLQWLLPDKIAYSATRWKNIQFQRWIYWRSKKAPQKMQKTLLKMARKEIGKDTDIDFDKHFTPRYGPWDQRLCLAPNGDFFHTIRDGRASVVTDTITEFTPDGIRLDSGEELSADVVVMATGLDLCVLGDVQISIDERPLDLSRSFSYKAMMFSDVPNLISTFGYINASWTLKADLTAEYSCRLLKHMAETGTRQCTPRLQDCDKDVAGKDWIEGFSSGYIHRKSHLLPKQGNRPPWINTQNYTVDKKSIQEDALEDGFLQFTAPAVEP